MNNKGQLGFLKVLVFAVLFIIFFSLALAPFVHTIVTDVANTSQLGALGSWLIGSFNFWILLAFVILILVSLLVGINTANG